MAKHLRSSALIVAAILIFGACNSATTHVKPGGWGIGGSAPVRGAGSERAGREAPAGSPAAAGAIPEQGVDDGSTSRCGAVLRRRHAFSRRSTSTTRPIRTRSSCASFRRTSTSGSWATRRPPTSCPTCSRPTSCSCRTGRPGPVRRTSLTASTACPVIENVGPAHIDASTWEGKKYGLPFIIDLSVWMYNKGLFTPGRARSRESAEDAHGVRGRRARHPEARHDGIYGTYFGGNCGGCNVFTWWPIIWAGGGAGDEPRWHRGAAQHRRRKRRSTRPSTRCGTRASSTPNSSPGGRSDVDPAVPRGQGRHHADAGQPPGERGHAARRPRRDCHRGRQRRRVHLRRRRQHRHLQGRQEPRGGLELHHLDAG